VSKTGGEPGPIRDQAGNGSPTRPDTPGTAPANPPAPYAAPKPSAALEPILESAARLQQLVPNAVLVGGSAAAFHAGHRVSFDHDHTLADLRERFDQVLEAIEEDPSFHRARVQPKKIILGRLGDIEVGIRQLRRSRPLETEQIELPSGARLTVPTLPETLRVKAYLAVTRNQVRDYLDIAALSDKIGTPEAAEVLNLIDEYYPDETADPADQPVRTQLVTQLAAPAPSDKKTIDQLSQYKSLRPPWNKWEQVADRCLAISLAMVGKRG